MDEDREQPWNFHTCKFCLYRSKSTFLMCKHVRLHGTKLMTDIFACDSKTPETFECEICVFDTNLKVNLTEHIRVFHEEKEVNQEQENIIKCYRCKRCDFKTHSLLVLTTHKDNCNNVVRSSSSEGGIYKSGDESEEDPYTSDATEDEYKPESSSEDEPEPKLLASERRTYVNKNKASRNVRNASPSHGSPIQFSESYSLFNMSPKSSSVRESPTPTPLSSQISNCKNWLYENGATEGFLSTSDQNRSCVSPQFTTKKSPKSNFKGKQHCCLYCGKMYVEMSTHLMKVHGCEEEITKIQKMPVNSKERNQALKEIRIRGDAEYNKSAEPNERIPLRHFMKTKLDTGVTCLKCSSLIAPKNFARHERRCTSRPANRQRVMLEARRVEMDKKYSTKDFKKKCFYELIKNFKEDIIRHEILSDHCLKLTAERYSVKHRNHLRALINDRQNIRRLARILLAVKEIDPSVADYEDLIIHKGDYDLFKKGIFKVCNFQSDTGLFERPALAQVLQSAISFMLESLMIFYTKLDSGDRLECQKIKKFEILHKADYSIYILKPVGGSKVEQRVRRKADNVVERECLNFNESKEIPIQGHECLEETGVQTPIAVDVEVPPAQFTEIDINNQRNEEIETPTKRLKSLCGKSVKRIMFNLQEKELIYKYTRKYIEKGVYPPNQMELYASILEKHADIFHPKRTIRHLYSFVQYRIGSVRDCLNKK